MNKNFSDPQTELLNFSQPKLFIFDLDGTLVDSNFSHMRAFTEALAKYAPEYLVGFNERLFKGRGTETVFRSLGIDNLERIEKLVSYKRQLYLDFVNNSEVRLFPDVKNLLQLLTSKGRITIIATSASRNVALTCLKVNGIQDLLSHIVTGEQAIFGKPAPDLFQRALRLSQIEPSDAVTIEDAEIGIQASRAAGIEAVLINHSLPVAKIPTFSTITSLYERVMYDFEKHEAKRKRFDSQANEKEGGMLWDDRFGERPPNYNFNSDAELLQMFELAANDSKRLRLLRLGAPLLFRRQVLSVLDETGSRDNIAVKMLLNSSIPSIVFLLADPDGVGFLNRLDYERAGTWGIWRVRHEVLQFVKALATLSEIKEGELRIGLHPVELIWNIGIIGDTDVLVRAYGPGTGHDTSVESQWLKSGKATFFAELFINFWEAITRHPKTRWITSDLVDYGVSPNWPSLYKGNAVLFSEKDFDKEDFNADIGDSVMKICRYPKAHEAERKWMLIQKDARKLLKYFRPVNILHPHKVNKIMGRTPLCMERVRGFSLFEIASYINTEKKYHLQREACGRLLCEILTDSIFALKEFRTLSTQIFKSDFRENYHYSQQLADSLLEVRSFIGPISKIALDDILKDLIHLGTELEEHATTVFRDAHLKNRMWSTKEEIGSLVDRLLSSSLAELKQEISVSVRDVDFETSHYNVTEWDDVIHILFFEYSGTLSKFDKEEFLAKYQMWWGEITNEVGLWQTLLARAFRELCRRIWYAMCMPNSYEVRYKKENKDFFLNLSLFAIEQLDKFKSLSNFLRNIRDVPGLFDEEEQVYSYNTIVASQPCINALETQKNFWDVFISYNRLDEALVHDIFTKLNEKGLRVWLDNNEISSGEKFINKLQSALSMVKTVIIVLGSSGINEWQSIEIQSAINQHVEHKTKIIPVLLPEVKEIPHQYIFLKLHNWVKFDNSINEQRALTKLISGIRSQ